MALRSFPRPPQHADLRYLREPEPIRFPEEAEVLEGKSHLILRLFLFRVLRFALGPAHSVGSDQFVYWNARDPHRELSPDLFVKLGVPDTSFGSWKTWEHGAPDLAVEIIVPDEGDGVAWEEKIARYHELGVKELVRFDPEAAEGHRVRAWDRVREDLVERQVGGDRTPCLTLGLHWTVCPVEVEPVGLRLVDDEGRLLLLPEEAAEARAQNEARERAAAEARAQNEARERAEERATADARIRQLEEQLRRARGGG